MGSSGSSSSSSRRACGGVDCIVVIQMVHAKGVDKSLDVHE